MLNIIFFTVCFVASVIGAICGIGGGVIIKPVLDSIGVLDAAVISFLSGCTVLSMSTYSVVKSKRSGESKIDNEIGLPLAAGASMGGILGKLIFQYLLQLSENPSMIGMIQAVCLFIITIMALIYIINKSKINTYQIKNKAACIMIGIMLGIISSFLGIGGGPINLVVLFFFFTMDIKTAAENSLYIIFFSQAASFMQTIITGHLPKFQPGTLAVMVAGGILGGILGRFLNKRIDKKMVDKLLIYLMILLLLVNLYNIYKFI